MKPLGTLRQAVMAVLTDEGTLVSSKYIRYMVREKDYDASEEDVLEVLQELVDKGFARSAEQPKGPTLYGPFSKNWH